MQNDAKAWLFRIFVGPLDPSMFKTKPTPDITRPLELPQQDSNAIIGVVFGTVRITKPNITWWGALRILKIKPNAAGKK